MFTYCQDETSVARKLLKFLSLTGNSVRQIFNVSNQFSLLYHLDKTIAASKMRESISTVKSVQRFPVLAVHFAACRLQWINFPLVNSKLTFFWNKN